MKALSIIFGLATIFICGPIWYYLLHFLLVKAGASELQMFLFWIYIPLTVLFAIFSAIAKIVKDKK